MQLWANLNSREKIIIGYGIPLVLGVVFYLYLWVPTHEKLDQLRLSVPKRSAELAWMNHEIEQARPWLGANSGESETKPILTVIESHAIQSNIKSEIQRVQPVDNNQVKMWFKEVVADRWFGFIKQLEQDGISVDAATITRAATGKVNVQVTLKR